MKRVLLAALLTLPMTLGAQMKGMDMHKGTGVVTSIDRAGGKVTVKHDPIKSLNWPAMTMGFQVKDKALLEKLQAGKKVQFEFVQQGKDYVITGVK